MPAVFVIDGSSKEPSPLVRRLIRARYHVLCLADCQTALEAMRCIRPNLMIIDVASVGVRAAAGTVNALTRGGAERSPVPVLIVGAKVADQRELDVLLNDGEIVPATRSAQDLVLERVGSYLGPQWPPAEEGKQLIPPGDGSTDDSVRRWA